MDLLSHWYRLCYTLWSPFYDLLVCGFESWRRRALTLADLQSNERVLLIGAGTGVDLEFIEPGPQLTAVDISGAMLARLRRRARRRRLDVDVRVMDGQVLQFADGSFDVVLLHLILAVISDPKACAREVARVLRPGGRAIILDKFLPDDNRPPLLFRLANPLLKMLGTNVNRQLGPILDATGLRIVHQESLGMGGFFKIVLLRIN